MLDLSVGITCRVRTRLRLRCGALLLVACLPGALLAAACTTGQGHALPGRATARGPAILQVVPAAFQLPAPIAREVVLPRGRDLLIAGGLTPGQALSSDTVVLDPATGQTSPLGRLAAAAQGSGGSLLGGRPVVFGGRAVASAATVQAVSGPGAATMLGGLAGYAALASMQEVLPTVLALAAASLLYVAVADLIPSLHRHPSPGDTARQLALIGVGIAIIAIAHVVLEH